MRDWGMHKREEFVSAAAKLTRWLWGRSAAGQRQEQGQQQGCRAQQGLEARHACVWGIGENRQGKFRDACVGINELYRVL